MLVVEVVSCEHYLLSCDLRNVYVRVSQLYVSSCIRRLVWLILIWSFGVMLAEMWSAFRELGLQPRKRDPTHLGVFGCYDSMDTGLILSLILLDSGWRAITAACEVCLVPNSGLKVMLEGMQVVELPFSLYSTFVIEARHGFNKVTYLLILTALYLWTR